MILWCRNWGSTLYLIFSLWWILTVLWWATVRSMWVGLIWIIDGKNLMPFWIKKCTVFSIFQNLAIKGFENILYSVKHYISKIKQEILFFIDIHGNTDKKGCFLFSNEWVKNFNTFNWTSERLFMRIMDKICEPYF